MPYDFLLIIGGYLLGSVSTAVVTCRLMGLPDPRTQGSGNPGATNVLRLGGKKAAIITLAGDLLKGLVPSGAATLLGRPELAVAAVGLAAFIGHLYPLYFGFKGGKGVATALGVLFGLNLPVAGLTVLTWLGMALLTRISSASALTAFVLAPVYFYWLSGNPGATGLLALMTALIFWRHRRNIRNLLAGTEPRIGRKKP
ncbi:glycerol-3-phosphate 1-O-acyltransferase PlsY [Acidihalobacter ferrooxydans]|uniref:Glycerol-3-phosphate acyltransferase n=1 Tax=Acidihalobacter ferrooxydans TaxID=1765967 RepID=A0A1P8UKF6_9GAMM|nr:glycerol-3-phosphate 1-O-acyltransferase PlsY [Acidihalobacter ferrooxydans]APZ44313.1 acyl-phosphate glycerol 3-phosphate acyltransferase [Acidihalobacter ferrooxydans]